MTLSPTDNIEVPSTTHSMQSRMNSWPAYMQEKFTAMHAEIDALGFAQDSEHLLTLMFNKFAQPDEYDFLPGGNRSITFGPYVKGAELGLKASRILLGQEEHEQPFPVMDGEPEYKKIRPFTFSNDANLGNNLDVSLRGFRTAVWLVAKYHQELTLFNTKALSSAPSLVAQTNESIGRSLIAQKPSSQRTTFMSGETMPYHDNRTTHVYAVLEQSEADRLLGDSN